MEKTTKMRACNQATAHLRKSFSKKFTQPSMTVPDQTMSMRTMLERHTKGLPLDGKGRQAIYEDDGQPTGGVNPKTLDLVDLQSRMLATRNQITDLTNKLEHDKKIAAAKRAEAEKAEAEERESLRKILRERTDSKPDYKTV